MRLAVIDLGANSAHLLIVQIWEDCSYTPIFRDRAMIRLGSPVFDQGAIDTQTCSNAAAAIGKFLQTCRHHNVHTVRAVATSAVREAENSSEFVERIKAELGIIVEVISGREEARLTALAATESLGLFQGKVFVMDVGGGTTEAAWVVDNVYEELWSLDVGPLRLLNQVETGDPPGEEGLEAIRRLAQKGLGPLIRAGLEKPDWALATSGSALCLGELCGTAQRASTSLETHVIVMPALEKLLERMAEMDLAGRRNWLGKFGDRADTVIPGGMIFLTAMEQLGIDTFITGGKALREGIIMDYLQREILSTAKDRSERLIQLAKTGTTLNDPRTVREQNILKLARMYHYDPEHCHKTLDLANRLFDELHGLHWLGDEDRFYLQSAALLHDIGYYIGSTNHQEHSQYLVLHSELEGFHQMELRLISNLVRYHSKEMPSLDHPEYGSLPEQLRKKVDTLAGILRVADGLDFTHRGAVELVSVGIRAETISLRLASSIPIDLEIHEAYTQGLLFEKALGRRLEINAHTATDETLDAASDVNPMAVG